MPENKRRKLFFPCMIPGGLFLVRYYLQKLFLTWVMLIGLSCGSGGESGDSDGDSLGSSEDILGSITSQSGSQADMQGWVIVATDRDSSISRVAEVNSAGLFTLKNMYVSRVYTLNLISPAYIMTSVLSAPGAIPNTIKQFFKITSKNLPRLIHKGPVISFQNETGIEFTNDFAVDSDADSIPDGIASLSLYGGFELGLVDGYRNAFALNSSADIDTDGISNIEDVDIDNDGLINIFDSDDDGDGILDVFDQDSDGDLISDVGQTTSDLYFDSGVEWITVQFKMTPNTDGTFKSNLIFYTKLRNSSDAPVAVQIRGAPSLLNGANVDTVDADGKPTTQAWSDRRLLDDGNSEDGSEGDLLFARKVSLKIGSIPTYHQTVFFQLAFGSGESVWFEEYAYTFPPITPAKITPSYSAVAKTVSIVGNPFGSIQDYNWSATVYDTETGLKVYATAATLGTTSKSVKIPANILEEGKAYQYKITAQVLDRVPGFAAYTVESELVDLE